MAAAIPPSLCALFNGNGVAFVVFAQPASQYGKLNDAFDKLMADVSRTLDSKNRDKFTQNLNVFKQEFKAK